MKKIKVLGMLVIVFSLIIGVTLLMNKKDYSYYLAIGDYVSNNQVINNNKIEGFSYLVGEKLKSERIVNEVNTSYLKNNMTSKKLLEMIEKDSYVKNDNSLVNLIGKSKYITVTLGINDVINQIKYDLNNRKLVYDKDIIDNKISIFKHNYHEIMEEIYEINDNVKVLLVGCYGIYGDEELARSLNDAISEIATEFDVNYVDLTSISDKYMYLDNELYLTSLGQEEIFKKVISLIKEMD